MSQIITKCHRNLSFAPPKEILQRGARCSLDRRFRIQRRHTTMKVVASGVRRTHTANKCHTHVKYTSVCISRQAKMNFSYSGSVALGAEDLNSHQLVSARGDCFEANAVIRLLSFLVGLGTETQWASDSSIGAAEDGTLNRLDWDVELVLVHSGSLRFCVLRIMLCSPILYKRRIVSFQ